jgi:hypothetical protein
VDLDGVDLAVVFAPAGAGCVTFLAVFFLVVDGGVAGVAVAPLASHIPAQSAKLRRIPFVTKLYFNRSA